MTLPQAEIDRIKNQAVQYSTNCEPELESYTSAYIAGASREAIRGREQERTRFIEFLQWLSAEQAEYSILYGGKLERFCSIDHDYTSEQIADLFLDTQKRKA